MSVEQKIKDLLARSGAQQIDEAEEMGAASVKKDTSVKTAVAGDTSMPKQGSSQEASYDEREEDEENQGAKAAASIKPNNLQAQGAGQAPNYTTVADATSVVNMQASSGNVAKEETETEEDQISEQPSVDVKSELNAIFGEDLSEDFRNKATSIFEAAVIARVNSEMEKISEQLQEQKEAEVTELKEALVEKIDSFLNYVVEQWMQENELAVENGLRTEIAEDFIGGLKNLFQEHYIEVPEEKYNVLEQLNDKVASLEEQLNTIVEKNIELVKESSELKKDKILSEMSGDLADTETEKLSKLLEGISYESDELFREKVKVVKENYFPKIQTASPEEQILSEEAPLDTSNDTIARYAQALSRAVKAR